MVLIFVLPLWLLLWLAAFIINPSLLAATFCVFFCCCFCCCCWKRVTEREVGGKIGRKKKLAALLHNFWSFPHKGGDWKLESRLCVCNRCILPGFLPPGSSWSMSSYITTAPFPNIYKWHWHNMIHSTTSLPWFLQIFTCPYLVADYTLSIEFCTVLEQF